MRLDEISPLRGTTVRVVRFLALMACCLALAGCSLLSKKAAPKPSSELALPSRTDPAGSPPPPAPGAPVVPVATASGILAGQVIDSYSRRPPPTYIQVALAPGGAEKAGAPIDVAADSQGYFTIQGLQPGRHYQLIARSEDGTRRMAATVWATPPNPRLLIRMSEDFAGPRTPAVPAAPVYPGSPQLPPPSWPGEAQAPVGTPRPDQQGWGPGGPPGEQPKRPAGLGAPILIEEPADAGKTPPAPVRTPRPDHIIRVPPQVHGARPEPTEPGPTPPPAPAPSPPAAEAAPSIPASPTRVPSCVLTGQTLVNFALNDLEGRPWEYRQHRARLTLIDFWGTWCTHCLHTIPHLKILQEKYGTYGLEIVGIAYEEGTPQERAQKVNRVRQRHGMNYSLLLGGDTATCPVRQQFDVRAFPTLVLVDDAGRIIWRGQGLDKQRVAELEILIRQRLGIR